MAADSVYGVGEIEQVLRRAGKCYVLGNGSTHMFGSWGKPRVVVGRCEEIAKTLEATDWHRISSGAGTEGPRWHDWCSLELADLDAGEFDASSEELQQ